MEEFDPADEAERAIADALRELQPARGELSSERIWYRAGVAAGRRQVNILRGIAAAAVIVAALSLQYSHTGPTTVEPGQTAVDRSDRRAIRAIPPAASEPLNSPPAGSGYLALREGLLERGLDALPADEPRPLPAPWDERNLGDVIYRQPVEHLHGRGS